jgi:hypothetical protein
MPEAYARHDPEHCVYCQQQALEAGEPGQEGVAALLRGEREHIAPAGFDAAHQRLTRMRWDVMKETLAVADEETA